MNRLASFRSRIVIFAFAAVLIGGAIALTANRSTGFEPTHELHVGAEHAYEFFAPASDLQCEVSHSQVLGTYAYCQSVSTNRSIHMAANGTWKLCESASGSCLGNPGLGTGTLKVGTRVIDGPLTCDLTVDTVACYNHDRRGFVMWRTAVKAYK